MRQSPETTPDSYDALIKANFHDRLTTVDGVRDIPYAVVGGLGLHAVTHAKEIDWDNHIVRVNSDAYLPTIRDNGTVRDLDTLVQSPDKDEVVAYRRVMESAISDQLVVSAFGLRPYDTNQRGILDFVGDRYIDKAGQLYWRLSGIGTAIPTESLEPWLVEKDGIVCNILNPVAQLGAYMNRSITGVRPKDEAKLQELTNIVMPHGKDSDIPKGYQEQYFAFVEQAEKLRRARKRLGWIGLKASVLSLLEKHPTMVELAQGKLDGVLSFSTGKQ